MMRLLALTLTFVAVTRTAYAQSAARAEALFRDGKQAMAAAHYEEACTAFEGSQRLDPNISTLINLADCREKNHQLAMAWGLFLQAASEARREPDFADLLALATKRANELEPRLSHLIINVPDESRLDGLSITRNGVSVDQAEWNRSLPVDGGELVIEAKAPDHEPWTTRVTVKFEGDKQSVDVPRFKSVTARLDKDEGDEEDEEPAPKPLLTRRRIVALSLGGLSLAALGTGLAFELSARSTYSRSLAEPNSERQTSLYEAAQNRRYMAGGLAVAGIGAAAAATILWVTGHAPATDRAVVVPAVGQSQVGLAISGGF